MTTPQLPFTDLPEEERRTLQRWLADFERSWEPDSLTARLGELPPEMPGRVSALCEAVKIDLRKQWQSGHKQLLDAYLETYPELGGRDGVALDLIQAEAESRREAGDPVSWSEYVRRFPRQTRALQRSMEQMLQATASMTHNSPEQQTEALTVTSGPTPASNQVPDTLQPPGGTVAAPSLPGGHIGRYALIRELGRGAMGTVYLAHDTQLDRDVALKIPHLGDDRDNEALARFYREARAVAKLDHPNICRVYDVGEVDGHPYFTMAYIEGTAMSRYLRDNRPVPQRRAAELVYRLALALQEAHTRGIIHRDLKPSNIMMNQRSEPIIMDFGLARRTDLDEHLTHDGSVLGTPAYMPKEQAAGEIAAIGPPCDIYSLGVILYELLAGQLPFRGSVTEILTQLLTEVPPTPPSTYRADLDAELVQICLKAMAPKVEQRYLTMGDFAAALGHYLGVSGTTSEKVKRDKSKGAALYSQETLPRDSGISSSSLISGISSRTESWRWWIVAGLLGGVLAGVLLAVLWRPWKNPDSNRVAVNPSGRETTPVEATPRQTTPVEASTRPSGKTSEKPPVKPAIQPVTFMFTSDPEAELFIDGKSYGTSTKMVSLLPGEYNFKAVLNKDLAAERRHEIRHDGNNDIHLPILHPVTLVSTPPGAVLKVKDGKDWPASESHVDQSLFKLPRGRYHLHASLGGHKAVDMEFDVPLSTPRLDVVLHSLLPRKFALLVGIRSPGDDLPDFVDAEPDVVELGRVLVAGGYEDNNVVVLTQTRVGKMESSAESIRAKLEKLARGCTPPDSLLVALVGHQVTKDGASYYCGSGSKPKDTDTLLPMGEVYEQLQKCKAGSKVLLVDSWRGYFGERGRASVSRPPDQGLLKLPKGVQAFFNCSAQEHGYEHTDARHGIFFSFLIRGLQGEADSDQDDRVTLRELVKYATDKTRKFAQEEYGKDQTQTPQFVGAAMPGEEVLVKLEGALVNFRKGADRLEKARAAEDKKAKEKWCAEAIDAFDEAAKADSAYVETYTSRAAAHYFSGKLAKAIADFKTALDRDPNNAGAHEDLAEVLVEDFVGEGRVNEQLFKAALNAHERAIKLDPQCALGYNVRGMSYYHGKDYKQALTDFRKAIEFNPKLKWPYYNCGQAALRMEDYKQALEVLTDCIKIHPRFAEAYELRARVHKKLNDPAAEAQDKKTAEKLKKARAGQQ